FVVALGHEAIRRGHRGIEAPVSTMGGMAAAASLARLDETGMRYAISYGAQQISGLWSWVADPDHIEKAFDIGGMGARNGVVRLPEDAPGIVSNSPMPDVNCQYLIATALVDGAVSFANSHSREHMADPQIRAVMQRVQVMGDPKLNDPAAPRSGRVEVTLRDGKTVTHFTRFPPGTKENPVDTEKMNAKARDLMAPVLGARKTEAVIQQVNGLETLADVRDLVRALVAG